VIIRNDEIEENYRNIPKSRPEISSARFSLCASRGKRVRQKNAQNICVNEADGLRYREDKNV
jgi:hypothetical protein